MCVFLCVLTIWNSCKIRSQIPSLETFHCCPIYYSVVVNVEVSMEVMIYDVEMETGPGLHRHSATNDILIESSVWKPSKRNSDVCYNISIDLKCSLLLDYTLVFLSFEMNRVATVYDFFFSFLSPVSKLHCKVPIGDLIKLSAITILEHFDRMCI